MSMAQLVAAGAPELHGSYFYRVRESSIDSLLVEIRRQKGRWRSVAVAEAWVYHEHDVTAEAAIVDACIRAFKVWKERVGHHVAYVAAVEYIGDHDPKGRK
ncbi:hypothetical protein [Streptomyces sp. NPDC058272]|uniref:hypothetical protein n=1 Tax=Streptomyces sp. NPDC058272 TaxID=3346415 RepID=UPI0036EDBF6A